MNKNRIALDQHLGIIYRLRTFGIRLGLETINFLMQGLGNPQNRFSSIHIAGTNGKGSIAAMLSSVLSKSGFRVGLYTSPHLRRFNERIQINGEPISDEKAIRVAETVQKIYTRSAPPTFFECVTAMALYHFATEGVDWAVLETGMGGRLDATNCVRPNLCIISNIHLDHQEYLGQTLESIAREKAGIIKEGCPVITGVRQKKPLSVIQDIAQKKSAPLYRLGKDFRVRRNGDGSFNYLGLDHRWSSIRVGLKGDHQVQNASLVIAAVELLKRNGVTIPDAAIVDGLASTVWPGRLEIISKNPTILLDGAHNTSGIHALNKFLSTEFGQRPKIFVVGIMADKPCSAMLNRLSPMADHLILTRPRNSRSADPKALYNLISQKTDKRIDIIFNLKQAIDRALEEAEADHLICITGSLFTVGEAREYLINEIVNPVRVSHRGLNSAL